jgi:hypothetical protein
MEDYCIIILELRMWRYFFFNILGHKEIKTTLKLYLTPIRIAIMKKTTRNFGKD